MRQREYVLSRLDQAHQNRTTIPRRPAGVRGCVVTLAGDALDDRKLVAYWLAQDEMAPLASDLADYLQSRLPDYMVPAVYVHLDRWPLTRGGKIDRRALPQPERQRPELRADPVAPRTPTEAAVAAIWSQVLNIHPVGVEDDFFRLGGHSLAATRVVAQIYSDLGVTVPLRVLFERPTLAGLARFVVAEEIFQMAATERAQLIEEMESL